MTAALGILGGTFDPVHVGHLRLAEEAREVLQLGRVRWIPAGQPRHRAAPATSARQRLDMVRLAIADHPDFELDSNEALSAAPSYSVPTLERVRAELGERQPLVWLMGTDAFLGLCSWHRWRELFSLAHVAIATRPGYALEGSLPDELAAQLQQRRVMEPGRLASQPAGLIMSFDITALDVSASALRRAHTAGRSLRYLTPAAVIDYIETHRLYA